MNRNQVSAIVCVLAFLMAIPVSAGPASDTPVVSTILDLLNGAPLLVQSDGRTYSNDKTVQSIIQNCGTSCRDWVLNTAASARSTRTAALTLTDIVPASGPGGLDPVPPFASAFVQPRFIAKCHERGIDSTKIPLGTTVLCPLAIAFTYDGVSYRLASNAVNYPVTNDANVTCLATSGGSCTRWSFTPSGGYLTGTDPNAKNIFRLLDIGITPPRELGSYFLSFSIDVRKP